MEDFELNIIDAVLAVIITSIAVGGILFTIFLLVYLFTTDDFNDKDYWGL